MSSLRSGHHSLPAPVVHESFVTSHSKSHVLAGVQDAYWSDEENEDSECPLCLEEMDISDLGFKPCPCGYQICRFCWHHIKENLNGRCPACRRAYVEEAVQFKPVGPEDHKRLTKQKKNKEKERKELEALNRTHLANVRVVQRNVVYIVGLGSKFAKEELIPTLRSNEYFGQYGKISKILLVKRTPPGASEPVLGLYVTYHRREDASHAIAAVDSTPSPSGSSDIMRASYGTTKYCMAFLRGVTCTNNGCLDLHEWGDERDCFTKEDLTTLKHTMKDTEHRNHNASKKSEESDPPPPPRTNPWGTKPPALSNTSNHANNATLPGRQRNHREPAIRSRAPALAGRGSSSANHSSGTSDNTRERVRAREKEKKEKAPSAMHAKKASAGSLSRPATPGSVAKAAARPQSRPQSPIQSTSVESEHGSSVPGTSTTSPVIIPAVPKVPPGLPIPQAKPESEPTLDKSKQNHISYQPSNAAQALLDDVRARRESSFGVSSGSAQSPFPDFDRTLKNLGDGQFTFDFEPTAQDSDALSDLNLALGAAAPFSPLSAVSQSANYTGSFSPFGSSPSSQLGDLNAPPGLGMRGAGLVHPPPGLRSRRASGYQGSFDPFAEPSNDASLLSPRTPTDGERSTSRFGFARRPPASSGTPASTFSSLSYHVGESPLATSETLPASPFYSKADVISPRPAPQNLWIPQGQQSDQTQQVLSPSTSVHSSSLNSVSWGLGGRDVAQKTGAHVSSFRPFSSSPAAPPGLENVAKGLHGPSRGALDSMGRSGGEHLNRGPSNGGAFQDPAIMSMRVAGAEQNSPSSLAMNFANQRGLGEFVPSLPPPPGLEGVVQPNGLRTDVLQLFQNGNPGGLNNAGPALEHPGQSRMHVSSTLPSGSPPSAPDAAPASPVLSSVDFPALASSTSETQPRPPVSQPYIQPTRPKIPEAKPVPVVAKKKEISKDNILKKPIASEKPAVEVAPKPSVEKTEKAEKPKPAVSAKPQAAEKPTKGEATSAVPSISVPTPKPKTSAPSSKLPPPPPEPVPQAPILSKMSRKERKGKAKKSNRADTVSTPDRGSSREVSLAPETSVNTPSMVSSEVLFQDGAIQDSPVDTAESEPTSITDLLLQINEQIQETHVSLDEFAFFNPAKINPKTHTLLQYGPLVHALSALSVGGGSFANNLPSRSIDTAVASFQTLLETLTQTISDLLRLLPRTTWDESSSFDAVLKDMLKGDDFLEEASEEPAGNDSEVAALTQALVRRARWMEVQLAKLEELHRDINVAAVKAVLAFNDRGWDLIGALPRVGETLQRFEALTAKASAETDLKAKISELEKMLVEERRGEKAAEDELRRAMESIVTLKPVFEEIAA
ncbi:hypothetical protein SISNIDRAFT_447740 [Sistotremastrum niveocremeum HHB9708]|uniref:RING-type domain-containing protein n=1 Tax=Sistotremastrum niveocremeum HHB9708 TaxID=1314777 RepID=A0A165AFB3_9AGAM|nr:hypothetical protein SISNIDRAFT_447740 [Sistotremastrum niveocremeum HHB9708]